MNTYKIIWQPYERFECPGPKTLTFEAPNDKLAFLKASPFFSYGCGNFNVEDLEVEEDWIGEPLEDLVEMLHENNGDGFDFLFLLKNEDTGEVIFEDGDYTEQEGTELWEEEIPEEFAYL